MKRKTTLVLLSFLLLFTTILGACNATDSFLDDPPSPNDSQTTDERTYEEMIRELEDKIIELQQSQYISDAEHQQELKKLQAQLAELKGSAYPPSSDQNEGQDSSGSTDESNSPSPDSENVSRFLYKKDGSSAIITGYNGTESHIVIPSSIDGYKVTAIGDSAFSSPTLKSVIISSGIEKIDWFAFNECTALISITIPQSVTSIGYSAFSPQSNTFTIYCHNDSFAHKYAKSYGWSYSLI